MQLLVVLISLATAVLGATPRAQAYTQQGLNIAAQGAGLQGSGSYILKNVQTGLVLSFVRLNVTNLNPVFASAGTPVAIQVNTTVNGTQGTQLRISGANNKCGSAQWNVFPNGGRDWAMVSYACSVGTGNISVNSTLENPKQWWYALPANTTLVPVPDNTPNVTSSAASSSTLASGSLLSSSSKLTASISSSKLVSSSKASSAVSTKAVVSSSKISSSVKTSTYYPRRRTIDLAKRAVSTYYYIIAQDHVGDMPARALIPSWIATSGGYNSTALVNWSTSAPEQLWQFILQ